VVKDSITDVVIANVVIITNVLIVRIIMWSPSLPFLTVLEDSITDFGHRSAVNH
jgi:hypothetical protein